MTAEQKGSLRCYRQYIEKTLNPAYVLGNMKEWLSDDARERIQTEEQKKGLTAAAALFVDSILQLESEGWFRGFLDALNEAGYTGLREAIENWDFQKLESLEEHRQLLKRIEATMRDIDAEQIIPYLNTCLIDRECEEIQQVKELKGRMAGAVKLIECLARSDKENWPKTFHLALERAGYDPVSKLWNMKEGNDKEMDVEMMEDQNGNSSALDINVQYSEEAEVPNFSGSPCSPSEVSQQSTYGPKKARSYQTELARPAVSGKNTIICAPTGSGKTFVALLICDNHLQNMPKEQKGKIVFLATKVPVYEQQKKVFTQHFERTRYKVAGISGETAGDVSSASVIEGNDIIVLTPQILVNGLKDGTVPSLAIFTLIIFDECHNTTGNHPYNVLMTSYLNLKFDSAAKQLPQIVGLTASVGVGSAKTLEETIEYICTLCACLDIQVISTIRENTQELEEIVYRPQKSFRLVGKRPKNHFMDIISVLMSETEALASKIYPIDALSHIKSKRFGTQCYEQWIVDTQKKCRMLQLPDKEEEKRICRALFIYTEHLRKYNDALIINEDARTQDALAYLTEFFNDIRSGGFDEIDQQLTANFEAKQQELREASVDELNENPKLEELTFILNEEYRLKPETRTLLFVTTRALVSALKKWIDENPTLSYLKPDALMGRSKRNQQTGMTLSNQKGVLDSFKTNGDSKILITTAVADEGIDIAQCNLVLLYEYSGNVTKMIQVRGRGRAKDSKCILVTSKSEVAENERNNIYKEEMMNKAIKQLQEWDEEKFARKINDLQNKEKTLRDSRKREIKQKPLEGNRQLLCGKCRAYACNTEDIRVIETSHHTVLDALFRERFLTKPHKKPNRYDHFEKKCKMYCREPKCQHDWGITVRYKAFDDLPVIKIESFVVKDVTTSKLAVFRKWREVDFAMREFDINEMSSTE
ncbi:antiviral innate immune response receptor RIG-I isoform X2 [Mauremys reevesii]|uniref:antiviral innate immune response receptor RIG-I isoform X2 n=1 Tax=Mauremys reevesii TaxID=260615 RepID=UPI00193FA2CD|nr:antiviral innate immune response receptor RIG-I isoform X2 [Mauremys reevesii]